jgi:LDH2 family malate/lactate/ureidoglycolate dehydrogenase
LAVTVIGVMAIVRATATINARAVAQTNADAVALVAADRGVDPARDFARKAGINVVAIALSDNMATATVDVGSARATASAVKPE